MCSNIEKEQFVKYIHDRATYDAQEAKTVQVVDQNTFEEILDLAKKYKILAIDTEHEVKDGKKTDKQTEEKRKIIVRGFDETLKRT